MKERKEPSKVRMFAPFNNEEHYDKMLNGIMNSIPKRNHFDVMLLTQMMISTFREKPEVARRLFK